WSVDTRRLRAEDLPSNLCWLFTPSRMILPLPVTRMRFLALLFVFCFGIVPFSFAIRRRRQPLATTSHAQTRTDLERDVLNFSRVRASCVLLCSDPIATGLHLSGLALGICRCLPGLRLGVRLCLVRGDDHPHVASV